MEKQITVNINTELGQGLPSKLAELEREAILATLKSQKGQRRPDCRYTRN